MSKAERKKSAKKKAAEVGPKGQVGPAADTSTKPDKNRAPGGASPKQIRTMDRPTAEILDVDLMPDEINAYARESARLHGDVANLKQRAKDAASDFKAKVGGLESRIVELNRRIESGKEQRQVACFWRFDYDKSTKTLFRKPTNPSQEAIEIKSYPLLPEERQMQLPIKETLSDRVNAAQDAKDKGEKPADPGKKEDEKKEEKKDTEAPAAPEERAPAGGVVPVETAEDRKVRIFFNGLDKMHRKQFLGIDEESAAVAGLLELPYRRLSESDREIVRVHFRAAQQQAAAAEGDQGKTDSKPD